MRTSKWLKALRFLIFFACVNFLLSFVLEPARGASELMWEGYYAEKELDTVFIGSSLCQETFDPYIFDENLGWKSFNMGTPLQALPQTLEALEIALEDHEIKTVIFGMGFSTLKYEAAEEAELTFVKSRARAKGSVDGLRDSLSYLYSEEVREKEKSINYFFPWLYNRNELSKDVIADNVSLKIENIKKLVSGECVEETAHKGYRNQLYGNLDYNTKWDGNSYRFYDAEFNPKIINKFEELIQLCKQHEVDLIVINTPHPSFDVVACYKFYQENQDEVVALCGKYDVDYYDFSLAKREIFQTEPEYYSDYEHLTREGSQTFCRQLCDFLKRREKGENLDECFYSVEEFLKMNESLVEEWDSYYW